MFYDTALFPWLPAIEHNREVIRDDMLALGQGAFDPWVEKHFYNQGWNLFGLYDSGVRLESNCERVPRPRRVEHLVHRLQGRRTEFSYLPAETAPPMRRPFSAFLHASGAGAPAG